MKNEFPKPLQPSNIVLIHKKQDSANENIDRSVNILPLLSGFWKIIVGTTLRMLEEFFEWATVWATARYIQPMILQKLWFKAVDFAYINQVMGLRARQARISVSNTDAPFKGLYLLASLTSKVNFEAHGLEKLVLHLVNDNLWFKKEQKKVGPSFSDWAKVIRDVSKWSF